MKSTATWEDEESGTPGETQQDDEELLPAGDNITSLRELTFKLLRQVQSIGNVHMPDIESGVDFYEEVSRFEIDLIRRALIQTGGHQRRAARLLKLKVTTLNSKIKHYKICTVDSVYNYPIDQSNEVETRRRA